MNAMIKGKIFPADERGINETAWFCSCDTFCFGNYQPENKQGIGKLNGLTDYTLAGGQLINMPAKEDVYVLVLPVAGAVEVLVNGTNLSLVVAGQAQLISAKAGTTLIFKNPFQHDPVNFLQCRIRPGIMLHSNSVTITYPDVNEHLNQLVPAITDASLPFAAAVGKFSGRGETVYRTAADSADIFLFVLEGAFEAAGRLLHTRDGLVLYSARETEIEALSNNALLLLVELPATV